MNKEYYHYTKLNDLISQYGYIPINIKRIRSYKENKWYNYVNNIMTFDTETSTFYKYPDGKWYTYDSRRSEKNGGDVDFIHSSKHTLVYLWTFTIWLGFEQWTFYGRHNYEFKEFILKLKSYLEDQERMDLKLYVFVHNLSFDFTNCLENIFTFNKVFCRKPHKPIYAECTDNIEFRCSYFLTNSSLQNLVKDNKFFKKLSGSVDYLVARIPDEDLDPDVIKYAAYDTMSLAEYLYSNELSIYKYIGKIPLTSTGKLRLYVKEKLTGCKCSKRDKNSIPKYDRYMDAIQLFQGGDTHANVLYADMIQYSDPHPSIYDLYHLHQYLLQHPEIILIGSFDETSAYPYAEISEKYPDSPFVAEDPSLFDQYIYSDDHCIYMEIIFSDIESISCIPYIKAYKTLESEKAKYDNGRIYAAKMVRLLITDVDYKIIKEHYIIKSEIIIRMYVATKSYLTYEEIDLILSLYKDKTELKGIEDREEDYKRSKNFINADFGRNVSKLVETNVIYDPDTGSYDEQFPSKDEIILQIEKKKKKQQFTSYFRGLYITAYSRKNLYIGIDIMENDNHFYNDTDSVKGFLNAEIVKKFIERNEDIKKHLQKILPPELYEKCHPKDIHGIEHHIGLWDFEGIYDKFITYGAKKYGTEKDGKVEITISGLKKSASKILDKLEDLKIGMVFSDDVSGRSIAEYQNDQPIMEYNGWIYNDKRSLSLTPDTYTLGLTKEYGDLIDLREHI